MRKLELLAPAKNLACGIAAIDHGADAVYIGASRYGARVSAGNTLEDIAQLVEYAHLFDAQVYVTVNTIIFDDEIEDTSKLIDELATIGVDAILVQDMGLVAIQQEKAPMGSIAFHASTQTDNRTVEKVRWLSSIGFKRVVLARELSIDEIASIHEAVPEVELEVFVHGALCVSYSGLCYASQYCFGRSANRGACAQFCRMKFDLLDADGKVWEHQRHLLSLKDMCQIDHLERLVKAGASSFKIEGRLKDIDYVKNVTAAYNMRLNEIVARHPNDYCRSSRGTSRYTFKPDLNKTFNRGYTTYFADGRQRDIASFDTPKAIGQFVGTVKELKGDQSFTVSGFSAFANGDGLCFFNEKHELEGFRVNKVVNNRLYPLKMPSSLRKGLRLYRNNDQEFQYLLSRPSAERKIPIRMELRPTADGFSLKADEVEVSILAEHQQAQQPQRDNIVRQLTKLGNTPYECADVDIPADFDYFIPSSRLAELRRKAVDSLMESKRMAQGVVAKSGCTPAKASAQLPAYAHSYFYNVSNRYARSFYEAAKVSRLDDAFELQTPDNPLIMQCRHCIRFSLGYCVKNGGKKAPWREPLTLRLGDGREFRLEFDCQNCQMNVYGKKR